MKPKTFIAAVAFSLALDCLAQKLLAQSVDQRLENIETHLRTDAANQNLERFDHSYVFNRADLDKVTEIYYKHVPYSNSLVLSYFRIIEGQPFILAVYEAYKKGKPNSSFVDAVRGHTVFLRRMNEGNAVVKSWTLMGNFDLFMIIRNTFDMVSRAVPNGQSGNSGPHISDQRVLFVASLHENGMRNGGLYGALSIDPPRGSPVRELLRRLDSFCDALQEGKFGSPGGVKLLL